MAASAELKYGTIQRVARQERAAKASRNVVAGAVRRLGFTAGTLEEEAGSYTHFGRTTNARPQINIQQFAGLSFFAAMEIYRSKDTSMAFAICLEAALYWEYEASPEEQLKRAEARHRRHLNHNRPAQKKVDPKPEQKTFSRPHVVSKINPSRETSQATVPCKSTAVKEGVQDAADGLKKLREASVGPGKSNVSSLGNKRSLEEVTVDLSNLKTASNSTKKQDSSQAKSTGHANGNKRAKRPDVFTSSSLGPGMAVLLRTEADEDGSWTKCWSLGKVLKIGTGRRTIDVAWLKPASGPTLPAEKIFEQRWVPWTFKKGNKSHNWTSSNMTLASVQYGTDFPSNGFFAQEEQVTLANEVKRLEALEAKSKGRKI